MQDADFGDLKIIGANLGTTSSGLALMDGAAALMIGAEIKCAISEDRLSRIKYDGHIAKSITYCLDSQGLGARDINHFIFSICCDVPPTVDHVESVLNAEGIDIPRDRIVVCPSHHLSHAASAFFTSPFDEALVLVLDNEGNVVGDAVDPAYWANSLERISFYKGKGSRLTLLTRDATGAGDYGVGSVYSSFTRWLGFPNYQSAGTVMGLAPYGNPLRFAGVELFRLTDSGIHSLLEPITGNVSLAVRRLFSRQAGFDPGLCTLESTRTPSQLQKDVARLVQDETERILVARVKQLIEQTAIRRVCIAGGVGLNCVVNMKLLKEAGVEEIWIFPAAGDTGQCIGNCLWFVNERRKTPVRPRLDHVYFGREYSGDDIERALAGHKRTLSAARIANPARTAAELIARGEIVFWHQGKAEFGPRALGNRSILADPRDAKMPNLINAGIKHREWYRPFCPSVREENAEEFFDYKSAPFMIVASHVRETKRRQIPAVVHVDNTARVQTVNAEQNRLYHLLLSEFYSITGVPIVLNTSFNDSGEPIVETPDDALQCFLASTSGTLIIGNYLVRKAVT